MAYTIKRNYRSLAPFFLGSLSTITVLAGCNLDSPTSEDPGSATMAILGESSDNADEADLGKLRGVGLGLVDGLPNVALRCDSDPTVTTADICGSNLTVTETYEWSDCQMGMSGMGRGKGGSSPKSNGTVEIEHKTTGNTERCDGTTELSWTDSSEINITRSMPNGRSMSLVGTVTGTSVRAIEATAFTKQIDVALQRQMTDTDGNLKRTVDINGNLSVAFSVDESGALRVFDGTIKTTFDDESTYDITLKQVLRRDASVCKWPVEGTLIRVDSDGVSHELVFSPTCGVATLDGATIDLTAQRGQGKHGGHGKHGGNGDMKQ